MPMGWLAKPLGDPLRALMLVYGTGREGVIANDSIPFESYMGSGGVCLLIRPGELLKP